MQPIIIITNKDYEFNHHNNLLHESLLVLIERLATVVSAKNLHYHVIETLIYSWDLFSCLKTVIIDNYNYLL